MTHLERNQSILSLKESGNTPLHVLCENSADTTMMKIIFECCPLQKTSVTASAIAAEHFIVANVQYHKRSVGGDCLECLEGRLMQRIW